MKPTLIIDADDTLWENEIYFQQCFEAFAELMAAQGFGPDEAKLTAETVEWERVPLVGYGPHEFSRSLVIAYRRLCERHDQPEKNKVSDAVWEIGQGVAEIPIVLLDGVMGTLVQLQAQCRLILLTKGDQAVQKSKVARSGLSRFFDGIHVVWEKNADVIRELLIQYGLQPEQTWMVGNSPRSDINPAVEAGIGAVYIPHSSTWSLEQEEIVASKRVIELGSFGELAVLFEN